jgi:hypothetical protein
MTGYVRTDTSNNIADGNIINASDLDGEFDGIQAAFNASTGHNHDGTSGEGAPILVTGPTQDVVFGATTVTPKTTNTVDIGSSSLKFKDVYITGTATLPTVTATTVNATTVDTTNVEVTNIKAKDGTASATIADSTGVMTIASAVLTTADINGGTADNVVIGGSTAAAGAFTTLTASSTATLNTLASSGATLTGGSINNMAIGASTASSGAFTTLAASGAVTLSGGTANGVAYLNGSKVLTTGSALTFDGTTFAAPLTSLSGNGVVLTVDRTGTGGNDRTNVQFSNSGTVRGGIGTVGASDGIYFNQGTTEAMRLTSTGLGIGTSSPSTKLTIGNGGGGNDLGVLLSRGATVNFFETYDGTKGFIAGSDSGQAFAKVGTITSHPVRLVSGNGTGYAHLDTSGNLGLGVTPSALSLSGRYFEMAYAGNGVLSVSDGTSLISNAYYDSNWKYGYNGAAAYYANSAGQHRWYIAPSGTAGNAITFTQAMTLDASGNLLLNTTSQIDGGRFSISSGNQPGVAVSGANYTGYSLRATGTSGRRYTISTTDAANGLGAGLLAFYDETAGALRACIDSSGNLLVGGTFGGATDLRLAVKGSGSTSATSSIYAENAAGTSLIRVRNDGAFFTGTAAVSPYNNTTGVATNMVVGSDGSLYRSTSSLKYKTDVQDSTHGLAEVMALRSVTYKGKNNGDLVFGGLIAEEVHEAGLTEFVQYAEDGTPDALAYGNMVSLAFKAIQEQQAIITALTARVAALEGTA